MLKRINIFALLIVAGTIIMIMISPYIYKIWIGDKVSIPFGLSAAIGFYSIISILGTSFSTFLNGMGKIRMLVILAPSRYRDVCWLFYSIFKITRQCDRSCGCFEFK